MIEDSFKELLVRTELNAAYWDGLDRGRLRIQQCETCGHRWLPARRECPACLHDTAKWVEACGEARLVSWVVYHAALHPAFEQSLPYNVAVVELQEGPRMITNIVDTPASQLRIDQPLRLVVRERDGIRLPQFTIASHQA